MLSQAADIASWMLIVAGALACVVGGLGMLRLPGLFNRMHAASVADAGGMILILTGLMVQAGFGLITAKLVLIVVFMLITSPTATHALARAARQDGVRPHDEKAGPS